MMILINEHEHQHGKWSDVLLSNASQSVLYEGLYTGMLSCNPRVDLYV